MSGTWKFGAPYALQSNGLTLPQIVDSVLRGTQRARNQYGIQTGLILCAMRQMPVEEALQTARLVVEYKNRGVVGFDLAGKERDNPAKDHKEAFHLILKNNINCTIHAGEAYGARSISHAVHIC